MLSKLFLLSIATLGLAACSGGPLEDTGGNNLIGSELKSVSGVTKTDGTESVQIAIFDEHTRRIRHFDLSQMTHKRSYSVVNPGEKHQLLFEDNGNYILDFSLKNITIIDKAGTPSEAPLKLQGTPIAAAFRPELGLIAVQDDMNSVGLMKLNEEGTVVKHWPSGSSIDDTASISSGDMLENGNLVLALSDGTLRVVDTIQTIEAGKWVWIGIPIPTTFNRILWLAPVRGSLNLIFIRTSTSLELFDLNTKISVSSYPLAGLVVEKYSKIPDAHMVLRTSDVGSEVRIAYVKDNVIKVKTVFKKSELRTLTSYLNLTDDTWSYIEAKPKSYSVYNDANATQVSRKLRKYRISDMLSLQNKELPNKAQLEVSAQYVFALFPSELGWAIRYSIDSDQTKDLRLFNAQDLK